jgi:hypothetical protein
MEILGGETATNGLVRAAASSSKNKILISALMTRAPARSRSAGTTAPSIRRGPNRFAVSRIPEE